MYLWWYQIMFKILKSSREAGIYCKSGWFVGFMAMKILTLSYYDLSCFVCL